MERSLASPDVQALRELGANLKRIGINAAQCAKGLKVLNTMRKLGVNEDQCESFILIVYENCLRAGLTPENIGSNLQSLIKLSKIFLLQRYQNIFKKRKRK